MKAVCMRCKRMVSSLILMFFCVTVVLMVPCGCASGGVIYVDCSNVSGPWNGTVDFPFRLIQDGVDVAGSGDTIQVASGTYNENVVIDVSVSLVGAGKASTVIDGGQNGHVIQVVGGYGAELEFHVSGFTVKRAGGVGNDCIALSYVNQGSVSDVTVLDSDRSDGIQLDHCSGVEIFDNLITGNSEGGGVNCYLSESCVVYNNVIQNNLKGVYLWLTDDTYLYDNEITSNSQYGVHLVQSQSNCLYRNDFTDNGQNAYDSLTNFWSYNGEGNYWDDYTGEDANSDGIGDTPYSVPGGSNVDEYPLGYFVEPEPPSGDNQLPVAFKPSVSPNPATFGDTVSFSGDGEDYDGYIVGYSWRSSRDGSLSSQQSFITSSLSVGTHTIYFKVKDNDGFWSAEKTVTLVVDNVANQEPSAYIDSISPLEASIGQTVQFSGHGVDSDGEITAWKWISSIDGVISTEASFSSSSLSEGTHYVFFQVMDDRGDWSDKVLETLMISDESSSNETSDPSNMVPVADAGGPYVGDVGQLLVFDGSGSYDADGTIVSWMWNFDDGSTKMGVKPTYSFSSIGTYNVVLTVTDDEGDVSQDSVSVVISAENVDNVENQGQAEFSLEFSLPMLLIGVGIVVVVVICGFIVWIKRY